MSTYADLIRRAADRRSPLRSDPDTNAYRLVNGEADGLPEVTIDWFDGVAVLNLYRSFEPQEQQRLLDGLEIVKPRAVYLKHRPKEARVVATTARSELAPTEAARGDSIPELEVLEHGVRFLIRPAEGLAVGLYLDMREGRQWLRRHARDKTVLNLFAYTCAFGVVASVEGARRTVNVDLSRRVLDWGMENARRNGLSPSPADHLSGEAFDWLTRLHKRSEQFDLVVVDPPSFASSRKGTFSVSRDYPELACRAARCVAPGGILMACCNHAGLDVPKLRAMVEAGLRKAERPGRLVQRLGPSSVDFPVPLGESPALKVLCYALG